MKRMFDSGSSLVRAITARDPVSGYTHNFYRYPARFSPLFVREVIKQFSRQGEVILDPFMGGGTAIVEGLALGRLAVGIDLNPVAHFVSRVKTTPLNKTDKGSILEWLGKVHSAVGSRTDNGGEPIVNLPGRIQRLFGSLMAETEVLPMNRQRRFVRCALLKTGQWALDCRYVLPSKQEILERFVENVLEMLNGLDELVQACRQNGTPKNRITNRRLLLCRSTVGVEDAWPSYDWGKKPRLVVTSPPYPGVHILYHRWQVRGRQETPAPYWLAALNDGRPASHYTFGSRSPLGLENYFRNLEACFRSVRELIAPTATVVQLVAFSDAGSQLPRYLRAMECAGFREFDALAVTGQDRVWRLVPNRKWYCQLGNGRDPSKEVVLFHRPA
jgi:hypothetical protein